MSDDTGTKQAGMAYAPPYDPTSELNPASVTGVDDTMRFDIRQLEYFQRQQERRVNVSRAMILALAFTLMAVNIWLTERNNEALLINVDQARLAQSEMDERNSVRFNVLKARLAKLEKELGAMRAACEAPPPEEP